LKRKSNWEGKKLFAPSTDGCDIERLLNGTSHYINEFDV
jgi:hypothetical protein